MELKASSSQYVVKDIPISASNIEYIKFYICIPTINYNYLKLRINYDNNIMHHKISLLRLQIYLLCLTITKDLYL